MYFNGETFADSVYKSSCWNLILRESTSFSLPSNQRGIQCNSLYFFRNRAALWPRYSELGVGLDIELDVGPNYSELGMVPTGGDLCG